MPTWLGRGVRRPQGSILGGIFDDFWKILEGFSHVFLHAFFDEFSGRVLQRILMNYVAFSLRAKMADTRNFAYLPRQNVFFQGARLRWRRR